MESAKLYVQTDPLARAADNPPGDFFLLQFDKMFSRLLERAVEMLEEKVLRVGENPLQLWLLLAGYRMFRSIHEPERMDFHYQASVDRATYLVHKYLGREEQVQHLKATSAVSMPEGIGNHIPDEVRSLSLDAINQS
jgi:hypothetical protein